jgi:hypothetical protein
VLACAEAGISGYVTTDGSIEDLVAATEIIDAACELAGKVRDSSSRV